jgi:catechol 2,3-dioxygenase-like lactoylglutathione lyase family enzyme
MHTTDRSNARGAPGTEIVDMPLEVLVVPVSDAGRAKEFYARLGWRLDADRGTDEFRLVQFTPPGEHEKRTGEADANWPGWYAAYMVAEQAGAELPV